LLLAAWHLMDVVATLLRLAVLLLLLLVVVLLLPGW
jgi:hypothetical protein